MKENKLTGADAVIFTEQSYPDKMGIPFISYLKEHVHLPEAELQPKHTIAFGPGRSSSTAWALLAASHTLSVGAMYQPLKNQKRHGPEYGDVYVPAVEGGIQQASRQGNPYWLFTKEVGGPFHDWEDIGIHEQALDPFSIWSQVGYNPNLINGVALIRDPMQVFLSNHKFDGGISAEILAQNYESMYALYEKYKDQFSIIPFAFDLCGEYGTEAVVNATFNALNIPFQGLAFDQGMIQQNFIPFEAGNPVEYVEIVKPTIEHGSFGYPTKKLIMPVETEKTALIQSQMPIISERCVPVYEWFKEESRKVLMLG